MKRLAAFILAVGIYLFYPAQALAAVDCAWVPLNSPNNPAHGSPAFCPGGFLDAEDAIAHKVGFGCENNCGGLGGIFGDGSGIKQYADINAGNIVAGPDGSVEQVACFYGEGGKFDQSVYDRINFCVSQNPDLACLGAGAGAAVVTLLTGGAASGAFLWAIGTCAATHDGIQAYQKMMDDCAVTISGVVVDERTNQQVCKAVIRFTAGLEVEYDAGNSYQRALCDQIPEIDRRQKCINCQVVGSGAIWTAVGCIPASATGIVQSIVKVGLGIAGGVALLMILAAGFMFSTSQGDPKRTGEARELITSAVIGLLFIIFSITILQFIGVTIFRIPGFGQTGTTTTTSGFSNPTGGSGFSGGDDSGASGGGSRGFN